MDSSRDSSCDLHRTRYLSHTWQKTLPILSLVMIVIPITAPSSLIICGTLLGLFIYLQQVLPYKGIKNMSHEVIESLALLVSHNRIHRNLSNSHQAFPTLPHFPKNIRA